VASCDFTFWDGNGAIATNNFVVAEYHDVINKIWEHETFAGNVPNDTGREVVYAPGVGPIPGNQTCYSFRTDRVTPDWEMTISASGDYSLACHFRA
jgi:hypothetical protein